MAYARTVALVDDENGADFGAGGADAADGDECGSADQRGRRGDAVPVQRVRLRRQSSPRRPASALLPGHSRSLRRPSNRLFRRRLKRLIRHHSLKNPIFSLKNQNLDKFGN